MFAKSLVAGTLVALVLAWPHTASAAASNQSGLSNEPILGKEPSAAKTLHLKGDDADTTLVWGWHGGYYYPRYHGGYYYNYYPRYYYYPRTYYTPSYYPRYYYYPQYNYYPRYYYYPRPYYYGSFHYGYRWY